MKNFVSCTDDLTSCTRYPCSKPQKVVDKPSWHAPHQTGLFPVSIEWEPPFTMLVDLVGHGDHQVPPYPRQLGCQTDAVPCHGFLLLPL